MSQNLHSSTKVTSGDQAAVDGDSIDFNLIISKIIHYWWLFGLSIIICLSIAVFYAYRQSSVWHISSKILVRDSKGSTSSLSGISAGGDIGSLLNGKSDASNEIQILRSRTLMQNTVADMQLNIRTYQKNGLKTKEIFDECPFTITISYHADTVQAISYVVEIIDNNNFVISNSSIDFSQNAKFGEVIKLNQYNLLLRPKNGNLKKGIYEIGIQSPDVAIYDFSKSLAVELSDKQASTIDLSIDYPHPAKGEAILNKLMNLYISSSMQLEKLLADSTISYIDSRIGLVSKDLTNIEKQFEQYKTANGIANISEQSKALISSKSDYFDKLAQQETQLSIIKDIERALKNPQSKNFIPTSVINSADQAFSQAIISYNTLLQSRDKASLSYTEDNPVVINIDKQLESSRINLLKNIESYKKSLQVGKSELQQQNSSFNGQLEQLPGKERNYLDFARQQNLKQELYLFLLQKREETAIARNSTISNSRIVDLAKSEFFPFKPKKSIIYLIGLVLGAIVPSAILFIMEMLNVRINTKSDIEKRTTAYILGEIGHNSDKQSLVTGTNSRSVISEQFRSLRTNMQFVLDASKSNVILFTSSMSGEGKSFLSLNIGSALALTDKKVVFMEMDLRKPKLSESIGLTNDNGFTNYAISESVDYNFKSLLKPLGFNKNCYLISSGPIPPNPAELLMSNKLEKLLAYLKTEFDYIIMDCAPVGLVTDALMLEKYTDMTFYVTRQGFTYKSQLNIVNDLINSKKMSNLYLIVNDIKAQKGSYSSYNQAYGYGIEEEDTSLLSKFKFWK